MLPAWKAPLCFCGLSLVAAAASAQPSSGLATSLLAQGPPTWETTFNPRTLSFHHSGGTAIVSVGIVGTTPGWTAVSDSAWVQPVQVSGSPGSGSVTAVAAPNLGPATRTATILIAGVWLDVSQAGSPDIGGAAGKAYTIAGLNPVGDGGPAASAGLRRFNKFDVDRAGNLYIAESESHRIRKISPSGQITTIAGNGLPVSTGDGGPASAAGVWSPSAIAVDPFGNVIFADAAGLRKISPAGTVTLIMARTRWLSVTVMTSGPDGSIYYVSENVVWRLTPQGQVLAFAGTGGRGFAGDGGPATAAQFRDPAGVTTDANGRVFIADTNNHRIRMVDSQGMISTVAGTGVPGFSGDGGPPTQAKISAPGSLAFDHQGHLTFADYGNHRLRRIAGGMMQTFAGRGISEEASDSGPASTASIGRPTSLRFLPDGRCFYKSGYGPARIRMVDLQGQISVYAGGGSRIGDGGPSNSAFLNPSTGKLAQDGGGNIYLADTENGRIRRIGKDGTITTVAGGGTLDMDGQMATQTLLTRPVALAMSPAGELHIGQTGRVRKVLADGRMAPVAGTGVAGLSGDGGPPTAAQIGDVTALAFDAAGNLYIGSANVVRKVSGATITRFAGTGSGGLDGDGGPAADARIGSVTDLAVDAAGNVYIASYQLRKVDPVGVISTVQDRLGNTVYCQAGLLAEGDGSVICADDGIWRLAAAGEQVTVSPGFYGDWDPGEGVPASRARTYFLQALLRDRAGSLVFSELDANRVRKLSFGFALDQLESVLPGQGGWRTVAVTAPSPTYVWTPASNVSWIHLDAAGSRTGDSTLGYTVEPNPGQSRLGTIAIGDRFLLIRQEAVQASLAAVKTHSGDFTQGQFGATYTVTVGNAPSAGPTAGAVSVVEDTPTGLTVVSMSGSGWTCVVSACTRADVLLPGSSFPPITVTVNVALNASAQVVNQVSVSGGGSAPATAANPTVILRAAAIMTSPAPGSVLDSTSATFQWGPVVGAGGYQLSVSRAPGQGEIYNQYLGTVLSTQVTGLPASGTAVYVRLWTLVAGQWQHNDYTYTSCSRGSITSPTPGTALTSTSVTFQWSTPPGVTSYQLSISRVAGEAELYNRAMGTAAFAAVTGLPSTGGTLYVRLWSLTGGGWQYNDYTYTACTGCGRSSVVSPAPGSGLSGTSVTFQWRATGAAAYQLSISRQAGGGEIYNQYLGSAVSASVNGLPSDGSTVWVRLWSLLAGVWEYNDYAYTAWLIAVKAAITAPAPGSTLTSTTATFQWTPGAGVTAYQLSMSRVFGWADLYNQYLGSATSVTVTGLPGNGGPLYVRLWSLIAGMWQFNDYYYSAVDLVAVVASPAPGSTFAPGAVAFQWGAVAGAAGYQLSISRVPGQAEVYNQYLGTATSAVVSGLPCNGGALYVRLWTLIGGAWRYRDHTYTACTGVAASLTAPSGSTFTSTTVAFQWGGGAGVAACQLSVSRVPGQAELYNQYLGGATSAIVTGLPANGAPVYVRLWSLIGGAWQYRDYAFTACSGCGP